MDPLAQQVGERGVDQPLAIDARASGELRGDDFDGEVSLAFRPGAGMTGMAVRVIDDLEAFRRKGVGQHTADGVSDCHGATLRAYGARVKRVATLTPAPGAGFDRLMKPLSLHLAAQVDDADAILRLLDAGADPDQADNGGERPLMRAAANGAIAAMTVLLDRGAKVDAVSNAGNTALMFAAARGQIDAVRMLIERGANTGHKNKYGLGPADWAQWSTRINEILPLLDSPPVSA